MKKTIPRVSINDNFRHWLNSKKDQFSDSSSAFVIVSEGGGIRSAYWTSGVLNRIETSFPNLMNNTYALSGVSGGSIGEVMFCSLRAGNDSLRSKWSDILGRDYLAAAIYGITIAGPIQSMLPFTVENLDRANLLEDAFSTEFFMVTNNRTLDKSMDSLYLNNEDHRIPNLFLNATHVETGKKIIISNLNLDTKVFDDDIDLMATCNKPIALKTAGLLSARFPGVSPSALLKLEGDKNWGRILDGGYFDNSGLLTAVDIVMVMKMVNPQIKPVIIFIRNQNLNSKESGLSNDLFSPISAFFNSWNAKTEKTVKEMEESNEFTFVQLKLNYSDDTGQETTYPLGWTLSTNTQNKINKHLNALGTSKDTANLRAWQTLSGFENRMRIN